MSAAHYVAVFVLAFQPPVYSQRPPSIITTPISDCVKTEMKSRTTVYCDYRANGVGLDEVQLEEVSEFGRIRTTFYIDDNSEVIVSSDNEMPHLYAHIRKNSSKAENLRKEYAIAKSKRPKL